MADAKGPLDNSNPNELQAWKCMMDSMVKFIQASTKLMNTFNDKAHSQYALAIPGKQNSLKTLLGASFTDMDPKMAKRKCIKDNSKPNSAPHSTMYLKINDDKSESKNEDNYYKSYERDYGDNNAGLSEETKEYPAYDSSANKEETPSPSPVEEDARNPCTNLQKSESLTSPHEEEYKSEKQMNAEAADYSEKEKDDEENAIRNISSTEKLELTQNMSLKLDMAQQEINDIKKDLQRLQSMKTTKPVDTAKLYKEIMKKSTIDKYSTQDEGPLGYGENQEPLKPSNIHRPLSRPTHRAGFQSDYMIGRQSGGANWQAAAPHRTNVIHRARPGIHSGVDKNVPLNHARPPRRYLHTTGYQQPLIDIYPPIKYMASHLTAKPFCPVYTRSSTPTDALYNPPRSLMDHQYSYSQVQPVYHAYGNEDDSSYSKDENFISDGSCEDDFLHETPTMI